MGSIVDRSQEFLGTSDRAVVMTRRLMLEGTRTVENGGAPAGVDPASYRDVRPHDGYVPVNEDWRTVLQPELRSKW